MSVKFRLKGFIAEKEVKTAILSKIDAIYNIFFWISIIGLQIITNSLLEDIEKNKSNVAKLETDLSSL